MPRPRKHDDVTELDRVRLADIQPGWGSLLVRLALILAVLVGVLFMYGFYQPPISAWMIRAGQSVLLAAYWAVMIRNTLRLPRVLGPWRLRRFDFVLMGVMVVGGLLSLPPWRSPTWPLVEAAAGLALVMELWRAQVRLSRQLTRPGLLLPASFALMILTGTVLLKLPVAAPPGQPVSWLEALFTMTSAVCVTGLTVRDTATQFTPFGQTVIGVFIQLGGMGIIIFGSMLALLLGRRLSLRENVSLSQMLNDQPLYQLTNYVRFIVVTIIVIELIGAALLYPQWRPIDGESLTVAHRIGLSLFHSVSAFCNAGFSLYADNLQDYRYAMLTHAVLVPLIVIGGLGLPVLGNIRNMVMHRAKQLLLRDRYRPNMADLSLHRMSLHTKIVLTTTAALYLIGVLGIGLSQFMPFTYESLHLGQTAHQQRPDPLSPAAIGGVLADASFMSVSARTAGFNTLPMDELQPGSRLTLIAMMFVGGSPGSTAGGVKTTVIAVLVLGIVASIRQRDEAEAFGRSIHGALRGRAGTLFLLYGMMITLAVFLLLLVEPFSFEALTFEVVSAATTTGLSLGITEDLTPFGQAVIIAVMFLGRVGPLALLGALIFGPGASKPYTYPHEDVVIG